MKTRKILIGSGIFIGGYIIGKGVGRFKTLKSAIAFAEQVSPGFKQELGYCIVDKVLHSDKESEESYIDSFYFRIISSFFYGEKEEVIMRFKATDFRAIAYGISAICIATAELHRTGLLDKAIDGGKQITNKLRKKSKKSTVKTLENPVIQQAAENIYYAECFRHGGYKN